MIDVTYYRTEAEVTDLRIFRDDAELEEWLVRQSKLEPIIILKKTRRDTKKES